MIRCFTSKINKKLDEIIMKRNNFTKKEFIKMPKYQQKGCKWYTGKYYDILQKYLNPKTKETLNSSEKNIVRTILKGVHNAVRKLKDNMILYRGDGSIHLYQGNNKITKIHDLKVGDVYSFSPDRFTSTSISRYAPIDLKYYRGIMYKILAPKGTNIVPILQNSTKPNEAEIIIMPGQKLKIIDISNKKNMTLITIKLINTKK